MAKLKQLMSAMLTEALDYALDWKSTLKAEMAFSIQSGGIGMKPSLPPHPADTPDTKLKRLGVDINPFW